MDVYFIPVGPDRHELYCDEAGDPADLVEEVPPTGRLASLYHKFRTALARAEQERLSGGCVSTKDRDRGRAHEGAGSLLGGREIAEQRLLWRLRKERADAALSRRHAGGRRDGEARSELQREADRHLKWTIIDGIIFLTSGALALVQTECAGALLWLQAGRALPLQAWRRACAH
jgi:hypothetical protein